MSDVGTLFFELIRVAIGTQDCLSRLPTEAEWKELFDMAVKQSLVGICFAGLHQLGADSDDGFAKIGMSEDLFFNWIGMATQINMRNETVNRQCAELQNRLAADGLRSCVLKGQGVAALYGEKLCGFRQSGDIDLWHDGSPKETVGRLKDIGIKLRNVNIKHANADVFKDTDVEIHFVPSWFYNPLVNRRFKVWINAQTEIQMTHENADLTVPTAEFNVVYLLVHIFRHLLDEGVGMRQLMDYCFALKSLPISLKSQCFDTICSFNMHRIASAVMWIMLDVFGIDKEYLLCESDAKEGAFLLSEVMEAGNFGHHDVRIVRGRKSAFGRGWASFNRNLRFVTRYPYEVICAPFWKLWHWSWRMKYNWLSIK